MIDRIERDKQESEEWKNYKQSPDEIEFLRNIERKIRLSGSTWTWRRPIIKFKISSWRRNLKLPPEPIKRSEYAESLFKEGAGWND